MTTTGENIQTIPSYDLEELLCTGSEDKGELFKIKSIFSDVETRQVIYAGQMDYYNQEGVSRHENYPLTEIQANKRKFVPVTMKLAGQLLANKPINS